MTYNRDMISIYQALSELEKNNEFAALCTVVKSEGSTPRHVGSKMLVYPDGKFLGTVGGGEMESRVIKSALAIAAKRHRPDVVLYNGGPCPRRPGRLRRDCGGVCGTHPSPCNDRGHRRRACWQGSCPFGEVAGIPRRGQR